MIFRLLLCVPSAVLCILGIVRFAKKAKESFPIKFTKKWLSDFSIIAFLLLLFYGGFVLGAMHSLYLVLTVPSLTHKVVLYCLCSQTVLIVSIIGFMTEKHFAKRLLAFVFCIAFAGGVVNSFMLMDNEVEGILDILGEVCAGFFCGTGLVWVIIGIFIAKDDAEHEIREKHSFDGVTYEIPAMPLTDANGRKIYMPMCDGKITHAPNANSAILTQAEWDDGPAL